MESNLVGISFGIFSKFSGSAGVIWFHADSIEFNKF